jgi:excisionase family DNA binding protein
MSETDGLLTTRQLQDLLQIDRITVYRMLKDGRLQGFKVGGQWRFSRQAIERWLREQQGDLAVVEIRPAGDELRPSPEALPLSCVSAIQSVFAEALQVGTVTTGVDGSLLTPVAHSCDFCNLILASQEGRQRCIASWRRAVAEHSGTPRRATCHAGLHYISAPIYVSNQLVGAIHAGQIVDGPPDSEAWAARIKDLARVTGASEETLRRALAEVPVAGTTPPQRIASLLERVADTFSEIGAERLNLLARLQRIAEISSV